MRNLLLKNFYKLKRNPSNVQVLLLAIIIILIIYILFGNQIISTAKNNLETIPALSTKYPINKNKGTAVRTVLSITVYVFCTKS